MPWSQGSKVIWVALRVVGRLDQVTPTGMVLWPEGNPWIAQEIMLLTRASLLRGQALIC